MTSDTNSNQASNNPDRWKRSIFYVLRLAGCILLLYLVFRRYDSSEIFASLKGIQLHYLAGAWLLNYFSIFISTAKWRSILKSYNQDASLLHLWIIYIEGQFFNLVFPGFVAGDASRIARTSRRGGVSLPAFLSVFLERFSGLLVLALFIGIVALSGGYRTIGSPWRNLILIFFLLSLVLAAGFTHLEGFRRFIRFIPGTLGKRVALFADKFIQASNVVIERKGLMGQLLLYSLLFIGMTAPVAYFSSRSVGVEIPFSVLLLYAPLIAFLSNLPVSISGVGVRENLAVLFYSAFGFQSEEIVAYALAQSFILLMVNLSGGLILLLRSINIYPSVFYRRRNKRKERVI